MNDAVSEIRALLREFKATDLVELKGKAGQWEIFFARSGAGPNPFSLSSHSTSSGAAAEKINVIEAEHLGLFTAIVEVGSDVLEGQELGILTVLDRKTPVQAPVSGRIASLANEGLVEFGDEIASIVTALDA